MLEEHILNNTKVKFYDTYITTNILNQKEDIDKVINNLIYRMMKSSLL